VLLINLGASEALMKRVIDELPGEVSLAFLPGTPDLPRWLREAREHGHEAYLMLLSRTRPARPNAASDRSRHRPNRRRTCAGCAPRWPAAKAMSASSSLGRPGLAIRGSRTAAGEGDRRSRPCPDRDQSDSGHGGESVG